MTEISVWHHGVEIYRGPPLSVRQVKALNDGWDNHFIDVTEADMSAKMLMDAVEERYRVEDWRNPEKGITRLEACLNALAVSTSETDPVARVVRRDRNDGTWFVAQYF